MVYPNVLVIGAGAVGGVIAHKCAKNLYAFKDIHVASRSKSKLVHLQSEIFHKSGVKVKIHSVDASNYTELINLLKLQKFCIVINATLPFYNKDIMKACLEAGAHYIDTANSENEEALGFDYKSQWGLHEQFIEQRIIGVLGAGGAPGLTNAYCAHAKAVHFDSISSIDIIDCNAGLHTKSFATNFNSEINIRELMHAVRYWKLGSWVDLPSILDNSTKFLEWNFPDIGPRMIHLIYHEELESLARHMPQVDTIRFWMAFSDKYLTYIRVLHDVGMTRIDPVLFEGTSVVPLKFLQSILPNPAALAEFYTGKAEIGCLITGEKREQQSTIYIYTICDHQEAFMEVGAQAVAYTTGVPAMAAAMMLVEGSWNEYGIFNIEQLPTIPFLSCVEKNGLPHKIIECAPLL